MEILNTLSANELQLYSTIFSGCITLLAAYIAVRTAFTQLARQFEHKVIYEGWKDLQQKLFDYSSALSDFDSIVLGLKYFVQSQDNVLVNHGNKSEHRRDKWLEYTQSYSNLQESYVKFLRSYENHEVIFLPLDKMKSVYQKEQRSKVEDNYMAFSEIIFPEMYGKQETLTIQEIDKEIMKYWMTLTEIGAFLDDFRRELQNVTAGKILNKYISRRKADAGYRILTKNGFILQKKRLLDYFIKRNY